MGDEENTSYYDVSELKKIKNVQAKPSMQPASDTSGQGALIDSMNSLTKNMDAMLQVFKTAAEEMKLEEQEENVISHQMKPITDKLDEIIEQNKIIAEGMIALSDLIKEKASEIPEEPEIKMPSAPPPGPKSAPMQSPFSDLNSPSFPPMSDMNQTLDLPPPPSPSNTQRKGPGMPPPNMSPFPNMPPMPDMGMPPPMDFPPPPQPQRKGPFGRK